ncbi:MAG: NADH-quinone oxidoreductase subunit NuoE [Marinisporobacter sp.]|jgi:NADH-quinone oxidoreductase subunit E|nr:NADH-quinone oxidoreductase subunit NuoE [Marinisporobacter sp.]
MECCGGKKLMVDVSDPNVDLKKLDPVLQKYKGISGSLITILQEAQELYGYLSLEVLNYIAEEIGVKPAKVHGVATFYTQFRLNPVGKYLIMLCQGTACHVNGSKLIEEAICDELKISEGETTEDGLFTLNNVACLGCCSLSPVMMINGETYAKLTPESTRKILRELREKEQNSEEV